MFNYSKEQEVFFVQFHSSKAKWHKCIQNNNCNPFCNCFKVKTYLSDDLFSKKKKKKIGTNTKRNSPKKKNSVRAADKTLVAL